VIHPCFQPWHDGHTGHHLPRKGPGLLANSASIELLKAEPGEAPVPPSYARTAVPFGTVDPAHRSELQHYPLVGRSGDVAALVGHHGYQVVGHRGRPDHAGRNYDTGHLPVHLTGDDYTDSWRTSHALAEALTRHDVDQAYGSGRRRGRLGQGLTPREADRAVAWAAAAADKHRRLLGDVGVRISEGHAAAERNTLMADAIHRVLTGTAVDPHAAGFRPHLHRVPLEVALSTLRDSTQSSPRSR
jgi:hypothetical protein